MKIFYVERKNILSRTCFNCSAVFKLSQEQDIHDFLYSVLISLVWRHAGDYDTAVAVRCLWTRCCCGGSLSGGPLLLLPAIRPFYFMSLASPSPRKASLTPTFTYIYILVIWCDVLKLQEASPPVVHILSPCCTFMNSCQFTSISSEKKIFVNSKT